LVATGLNTKSVHMKLVRSRQPIKAYLDPITIPYIS